MPIRISNKGVRDLVKYAGALGYQWDGRLTGSGHLKLRHPNGMVILPATPGPGGRSLIEGRKQLERTARDGHRTDGA